MDVIHHQTQFTISSTNSNFSTLNCNSLNSSSNSTSNITSNIKNIDNKNDQQQQQHQQQQQQTIQQQNSLSTCSSTTYDNINDEHYFNPTIYETFNQQNHLINTENNFNHIVTPLSSTSIDKSYMGYPIDPNLSGLSMLTNSTNYHENSINIKEEIDINNYSNISNQKENSQQLIETIQPSTSTDILNYHSCFYCNDKIYDKWLYIINNTNWHSYCLKCYNCNINMNDNTTCFWKDNKIYCKNCYQTQFVDAKCASCQRTIGPKDWVRRAREFVYHLACFACSHCKRQLSTGEEFTINDNKLLCKQHYMELIHGHCKTKTKRVRTTFAEEQLSVLQAHFQIDSNPDGADLEKIANITGLSKRVTQVWFQNSRARQKKYQGNKKLKGCLGTERCGSVANTITSGRSSVTSSNPVSPNGSCEGMMFPTSVTTSTEEPVNSLESKQMETLCYEE